ncbi:CheY-like chemotaxis protein [Saonia flava]|uniref:CheY-like chemotaxis protein n=1 Tax=Saonia flava TaxID=523696 RepID=A0A846QSF3_9FLAO|nr:response regulator [Saonia flava]NJB70137.1 CheY-like chemotaxis protein [Saonia flava]
MNSTNLNQIKILVVEDDPITTYIILSNLKTLGIEQIDSVENGLMALEYLKTQKPDLILLDLNMPIMDGFEFLKAKKRKKICPRTSVAILTSSIRPNDQKKASKFKNVIKYLEKPINMDSMSQILFKILKDKSHLQSSKTLTQT